MIKSFEEFINESTLNEVRNVNGSKVLYKKGELMSILDENNQELEYTDIETAFDIINKEIDRIYNSNEV